MAAYSRLQCVGRNRRCLGHPLPTSFRSIERIPAALPGVSQAKSGTLCSTVLRARETSSFVCWRTTKPLREFPSAEALAAEISEHGFDEVTFERQSLGIVAIHTARKPRKLQPSR